MKILRTAVPAVVGAAAMYVFDPAAGRGRRSRLRDRAAKRVRRVRRRRGRDRRYLRGVEQGAAARARGAGRFHQDGIVDLREHVRGMLHERGFIDVNVDVPETGRVVLRGQVPDAASRVDVMTMVRDLQVVDEIDDLMHLPGEPAPNKQAALSARTPSTGPNATGPNST